MTKVIIQVDYVFDFRERSLETCSPCFLMNLGTFPPTRLRASCTRRGKPVFDGRFVTAAGRPHDQYALRRTASINRVSIQS